MESYKFIEPLQRNLVKVNYENLRHGSAVSKGNGLWALLGGLQVK